MCTMRLQEPAVRDAVFFSPLKGQLLAELAKRVRANPAAIAQYGLQDHVRSIFAEETEMVRSTGECPLIWAPRRYRRS